MYRGLKVARTRARRMCPRVIRNAVTKASTPLGLFYDGSGRFTSQSHQRMEVRFCFFYIIDTRGEGSFIIDSLFSFLLFCFLCSTLFKTLRTVTGKTSVRRSTGEKEKNRVKIRFNEVGALYDRAINEFSKAKLKQTPAPKK